MFLLIPYEIDVPRDRWPVANWLIILVTVCVFVLQIPDLAEAYGLTNPLIYSLAKVLPNLGTQGITNSMVLTGWSLRGLFGHIWLHSGFLHLFGNMLFLWLFGNAVCAKIGNLRYLLLYILLGITAGAAHLLFSGQPALGASGAINGVVGMYLVFFYQNEIICLFLFWFFLIDAHTFAVSSIWLILLWLLLDVVGAVTGRAGVAYFAHIGGFVAGFGIALFMCAMGWVTMERYEQSLLQAWQRWRNPEPEGPLGLGYVGLGMPETDGEEPAPEPVPPQEEFKPIPLPGLESTPVHHPKSMRDAIRTACACGQDVTVSRQYAGRTVRCPRCGQCVVIPQQSDFFGPAPQRSHAALHQPRANDRGIRFACTCGRRIKVPAKFAGRFGKCPQCGLRLHIPPASA